MREIKFRCWYDNRMHKVVDIDFAYEKISLFGADIINFKDGKLMQYTGLKDKNGKEVYIGDILEYTFTDYKGKELWTENYIVKENISGWEMRNITKPRGHRSLSLVKNYKVIGNIYDNPELLEV